jgi:hypothetical protein
VSAYRQKIQTGNYIYFTGKKVQDSLHDNITIDEFVDFLLGFDVGNYNEAMNNHWCPQSWLTDSMDDLDYVGCLENIQEDWKELERRGLLFPPHLNKTKGDAVTWQQVLSPETEAKARQLYQDDFRRWSHWWN